MKEQYLKLLERLSIELNNNFFHFGTFYVVKDPSRMFDNLLELNVKDSSSDEYVLDVYCIGSNPELEIYNDGMDSELLSFIKEWLTNEGIEYTLEEE